MATVKADSANVFDDRGYSGPLTHDGRPLVTLLEKGLRERIVESLYFKEQCFGLNEATLCDRATSLTFCGGTYGISGKPTPFACLMLKMLALGIEKEIVLEYLNYTEDEEDEEAEAENGEMEDSDKKKSEEDNEARRKIRELRRKPFKYLRLLAAWYIRLTFPPAEVYKTLEPLLNDFSKVRRKTKDGFRLTTVDAEIDTLLSGARIWGSALPKIPSREILVDLDLLEERESPLQDEVDAMDEDDGSSRGSRYSNRSRSRSWSQDRDSRSRSTNGSYTRSRSRSRSPCRDRDSRDRYSRSRSRSEDYRRRRRSMSVDSRDGQ